MSILVAGLAPLATIVLIVRLYLLVRSGGGASPAPRVHDWTLMDQPPERPYRELRTVM